RGHDPLPEPHVCQLKGLDAFRGRDPAGDLPWKANAGSGAEAELPQAGDELAGTEAERELRRDHVAGMLNHLGQGDGLELLMGLCFGDRLSLNLESALFTMKPVLDRVAVRKRHRDGQGLDRRARFETVR